MRGNSHLITQFIDLDLLVVSRNFLHLLISIGQFRRLIHPNGTFNGNVNLNNIQHESSESIQRESLITLSILYEFKYSISSNDEKKNERR